MIWPEPNPLKCPWCSFESHIPMLHSYDKKNMVMMPEWITHFESHNKTPEEGVKAVLSKT